MKKLLLIDLGGVLIDLDWENSIKPLFLSHYSEENWFNKWSNLESLRKLETGKVKFEEFLQLFSKEIETTVPIEEVENGFMNLIGGLKPGVLDCLNELSKDYSLAMLSNTSAPHIGKVKTYPEFLEKFDFLFYSFNLGVLKPDRSIFKSVCETTSKKPKEIIFFDDSQTNIEGAKLAGLHAFRVDSACEIPGILKKLK